MDIDNRTPALFAIPGGLPTQNTQSADQMRRIANDFEVSFLSAMMKPMFESLKTDGPFGGGAGEEMWKGFLVDEMAKETVRAGGVGLTGTVLDHMLKVQEGKL